MDSLSFLKLAIALLFAVSSTSATEPFKTGYFKQKVDHFVYTSSKSGLRDNLRYTQRYLYTDKYYKKNGPIFFYTGNEGPIESFWNNTGLVFELAPKFGALVVFGEHRYYGKSLPFGSSSFEPKNLQYLTIEQALADYAVLLHVLRVYTFNIPNAPVIAFGGSYGGMLTQYMRFKYPNLIEGGIVGSAPFYWIANLTQSHPDTFFADVTHDYSAVNPKCPSIVRAAFAKIHSLARSGASGMRQISQSFGLCQPIANATDLRQLYGWARNAFVVMAMGDYPYPTGFLASLPAWPVNASCAAMLKQKDSLAALRAAVEVLYGGLSSSNRCHDTYKEYVFCADPTGCGTGPESIAWDFQACTEMHLPLGSDNKTDMFPPLAFTTQSLQQYCADKYGVQIDVEWLGVSMWGADIASASNLVFSNGDLDPWHNGGLLHSLPNSKDLVAVRIPLGAHHLDLRGSNPADPPGAIRARQLHEKYIRKWLGEYRQRKQQQQQQQQEQQQQQQQQVQHVDDEVLRYEAEELI